MMSKIESILFVASKPLSTRQLSKAVGVGVGKIEESLETLIMKFNREDSGIHIFYNDGFVQMGTNPENGEVIKDFIKDQVGGELTKAQLETLTVIVYRGPITRPELEEIRGVNCAIIIRNLLIKGLIEEHEDDKKFATVYNVSFDALAHLGITNVSELPDYKVLSEHKNIEEVLKSE